MTSVQHLSAHGRARFAVCAVAALLLLSGCTAADTPSPTSSSTTTPSTTTQSADAEPALEATESAHAPDAAVLPWRGDCSAAVGTDELAAAVGVAVVPWERDWSLGDGAALGGQHCVWVAAEPYMAAQIDIWAAPENAIDPSVLSAANTGPAETGHSVYPAAQATSTAGGVWIAVRVESDTDDPLRSAETILAAARATIADHPQPVAPRKSAQWWAGRPCGVLDPDLEATQVEYALPATDVRAAFHISAGVASCTIRSLSSEGAPIVATFVPGGAPAYEAGVRLGDGVAVDVAGATGAVVSLPFVWEPDGTGCSRPTEPTP